MKISVILLPVCAGCLVGCSSLLHDPLVSAYKSGEISKEEFERRSLAEEEALARTSPAFWEREQTGLEHQSELTPGQ